MNARTAMLVAAISITALFTAWIIYSVGKTSLLWIANLYGAAVSLALISPISIARRTAYLNAAIPHMTLFSASAAALLTGGAPGKTILVAAVLNLLLVFTYQRAIAKGVSEEIATSLIVGLTTSLSVLALYFLYKKTGYSGLVAALLVGDPLLVSTRNAVISVTAASAIAITMLLTWKEHIIVGIDRDYATARGMRTSFYDYVYYALLGLTSIIYIRAVGYILLHVLVLMPGSIAMLASTSLSGVLPVSLALTLLSSSMSLLIGLYIDVSPVGLIGILMLFLYVLTNLMVRTKQ
jgi:ABC-type Mn2+/Zn2+ transport system permease subunit